MPLKNKKLAISRVWIIGIVMPVVLFPFHERVINSTDTNEQANKPSFFGVGGGFSAFITR